MSSRLDPSSLIVGAAVLAARQSSCMKSKRGVVLWDPKFDEGLYTGYNRPAVDSCLGNDACKSRCSKICLHAEQMALLAAQRNVIGWSMLHVKIDGKGCATPSGSPSCLECSKLVLGAGIAVFWLLHQDGWKPYPIEEFHRKTLAYHYP